MAGREQVGGDPAPPPRQGRRDVLARLSVAYGGRVSVVYIARCPAHGLLGERTACFECGGPVEQVPMVAIDYFTPDELEWLEAAARLAAGDKIAKFAAATDALMELALKLRRLRAP